MKFYIHEALRRTCQNLYGDRALIRVDALLSLMHELQDAEELVKLEKVNKFFNQLLYVSDSRTWNRKEYWASRLEFLGKGQGDCEDYAVAKYLTLKQLGVEEVFLTYAIMTPSEERHLLVIYKGELGYSYLDNYNQEIKAVHERIDFVPVYAFNEDTAFVQDIQGNFGTPLAQTLKPQRKLRNIDQEIFAEEEKS